MTTMITEVYDALKDAGAADDKARRAAEVPAAGDMRHQQLLLEFEKLRHDVDARFERLDGRVDKLSWMVGVNIALSLIVLGKLFLAP